jgi:hypothetical protein
MQSVFYERQHMVGASSSHPPPFDSPPLAQTHDDDGEDEGEEEGDDE